MSRLIAQNLAPIMFVALVIFLLLGFPVAFSLAANGLLFFFLAVELAPYAPETIILSTGRSCGPSGPNLSGPCRTRCCWRCRSSRSWG